MDYSARFTAFMPFIFEHEDAYAKGHYGDEHFVTWENEDGDPGGVTKYGIDQRSHPHEDIKNLTKERANEIYWNEYWQKNGCEDLAPGLGEAHMNACVNCGAGQARVFLQGSSTVKAYLDRHEAFYRRLVEQKPRFGKFLKGWLNRLTDLRVFLKV